MSSVIFKGKSVEEYDAQMIAHRRQHKEWRDWLKSEGTGFFPVFSEDFKTYLTRLSGNALKLYLFLGAYVDNKTGETTLSLNAIANFFGAKLRTVQGWMQELTDEGLVQRIQTGYKNRAHTFVLPYSPGFKRSEKQQQGEQQA